MAVGHVVGAFEEVGVYVWVGLFYIIDVFGFVVDEVNSIVFGNVGGENVVFAFGRDDVVDVGW